MNKRLRKKKHRGEFQELGFELSIEVHRDMTPNEFYMLIDRFIASVESHQLVCGGGGCPASGYNVFVSRQHRGSATENDRQAISAFVESEPKVIGSKIGPLIDSWYG